MKKALKKRDNEARTLEYQLEVEKKKRETQAAAFLTLKKRIADLEAA